MVLVNLITHWLGIQLLCIHVLWSRVRACWASEISQEHQNYSEEGYHNNTRKCTTLWGEPDRVHAQNMEQLHAFDCYQNVAEPQATGNQNIHTCTQKLWVRPGYNIQACCTQAGPAQAASRGDGMDRWQHSSHLLLHQCTIAATGSLHRAIVWSPVTNTGTVSQANRIDRLPCSYDITLATE